MIVGDDALGVPCGTIEFVRTKRRLASPLPLCVIPSGATKRSRGISTAQTERGRGMNTPNFFLQKKLLCAIEVQRFYLDPATASPCGLLARQSLASQTSTSLRCAQDDTDGGNRGCGGTKATPYESAQTKRRRLHVIVGDDALGVPCSTMKLAQTKRLLATNRGSRAIKDRPYGLLCGVIINRGWRAIPHLAARAKSPLRGCANSAATSAFPKRGKGDRRRRWMRMSAVALWEIALTFACVRVCTIRNKSWMRTVREASPYRLVRVLLFVRRRIVDRGLRVIRE